MTDIKSLDEIVHELNNVSASITDLEGHVGMWGLTGETVNNDGSISPGKPSEHAEEVYALEKQQISLLIDGLNRIIDILYTDSDPDGTYWCGGNDTEWTNVRGVARIHNQDFEPDTPEIEYIAHNLFSETYAFPENSQNLAFLKTLGSINPGEAMPNSLWDEVLHTLKDGSIIIMSDDPAYIPDAYREHLTKLDSSNTNFSGFEEFKPQWISSGGWHGDGPITGYNPSKFIFYKFNKPDDFVPIHKKDLADPQLLVTDDPYRV